MYETKGNIPPTLVDVFDGFDVVDVVDVVNVVDVVDVVDKVIILREKLHTIIQTPCQPRSRINGNLPSFGVGVWWMDLGPIRKPNSTTRNSY